jgi:hypothetical protein
MTVSLIGELLFFLQSILFGAFAGVLYDVFRFLRDALGLRSAGKRREALPASSGREGKRERQKRARKESGAPTAAWTVKKRKAPRRTRRIKIKDTAKRLFGKISLKAALTFALDLLYTGLCGALYAVFLYEYHSGILRFYSLAALALGAAAYALTLGRVLSFLLSFLSKTVKGALKMLFLPIFAVFFNFFRKICPSIRKILLCFKRLCDKIYMNKEERKNKK